MFLKNCIRYNIIPLHLNCYLHLKNNLRHIRSISKFNHLLHRCIERLLVNEIRDAHSSIRATSFMIMDLTRTISSILPITVCNNFFSKQYRSLQFHFASEHSRLDEKFKWILNKHLKSTQSLISPLRYFCSVHNNIQRITSSEEILNSNSNDPSEASLEIYSFTNNPSPSSFSYEIILDPSNFKIPITFVFDKQDKWFVNLSNSIIPEEVQSLLQLGENFCLPNINKQKTTIDLIKKS